ncbi:codeine O-demethylase-like [Aegilops tauschii subsp. strangulata]|uniref:codeine O-demethylase-like n=1 Tax=Aegilops tauschii subsp. strangulata TaxID=200361 RepID=UPI00098ADFC6|nr:codeine O-demethylase-like [Aegilops tauschii subsp. strangulata]
MADESWRLPNSVQQLAATVQERPSRYLLREHELLGGHRAGTELLELIPTVDLGLPSASNDVEEANKLRSALWSWGFFLVSNHGTETSLIDLAMTASREFFTYRSKRRRNAVTGYCRWEAFRVEGYGNDQVRTQEQRLDWS